ncbi:MAG TPA: hypothetical protein VGM88_09975 [Kofleriaceae bacterium]
MAAVVVNPGFWSDLLRLTPRIRTQITDAMALIERNPWGEHPDRTSHACYPWRVPTFTHCVGEYSIRYCCTGSDNAVTYLHVDAADPWENDPDQGNPYM